VLVTSNDVIHAFAIPAFGVKEDAIQGRVNETWFNVDRAGRLFYGQCSELCGAEPRLHADRNSRGESREEWEQWIAAQGGTIATAETCACADGDRDCACRH
jgi:cytochrome c oxidase subunit 2